ncbi:MAG: hypothetical protein ABSE75_13955 [Acidimicrobiales bacterium]
MFQRPEDLIEDEAQRVRTGIVVAGPGSSLTIPGIIATEIVQALAQSNTVRRIEVDFGLHFKAGIHRAPSLAAAHDEGRSGNIVRHRAPANSRLRTQAFREWIGSDTHTAIAYAWPGNNNDWIDEFFGAARAAKAKTVVLCESPPRSAKTRAVSLAPMLSRADHVIVGDPSDADELRAAFESSSTRVDAHQALSLGGRSGRSLVHQITAFLPKDDSDMLFSLLAAFDAIPEAWIEGYQLQVVMRNSDIAIPAMVASSYHFDHVRLIGEDISTLDFEKLCSTSSALIVADPALDSRAFSTAVDCGIATVVLTKALLPLAGRGYVGGLMAELGKPASIYVALTHALRLAELRFPTPEAWLELAQLLDGSHEREPTRPGVLESTNQA